ncbi:MAG: PQQ-binding-like beta-propeller repeat protein [Bifidobacteriaceae bacterium]|jgi:hypothetical protein|nr:PQQ-binding-like beta-propeller repeat protein [Bifidobacteriaceae bacterium]
MAFDPAQGEFAAQRLLSDPSTDGADLAAVAGAFPALLAQVAGHPRLYPDLEAWLGQLHRPDVDAALRARSAGYPGFGAGPAYPPGQGYGGSYGAGGEPAGPAPKKPAKKKLWVAVAAVVALALAGGAVWFVGLRPGGGSASKDALAPDFTEKPSLEEVAELTDVFPEASVLAFLGFLNDTTVLVSSEPVYVDGESDGSPTFLAAVDLTSPDKPKWTLDLNEALDEETLWFTNYDIGPLLDDQGNTVVWLTNPDSSDDGDYDMFLVAVDSSGKLLSRATLDHEGGFEFAGSANGLVVLRLWDSSRDDLTCAAYRLADLESVVWEADGGDRYCQVLAVDGATWVVTDDGLVDFATGEEVGFDYSLSDDEYLVVRGDAIFVSEYDERSDGLSLTRVDKKGAELWKDAVDLSNSNPNWVVRNGQLYFADSQRVTAVDLNSGEKVWKSGKLSYGSGLCVAGNGNIVVAGEDGRDGSILDAKTGEELADDLDGSLANCGDKVVYAVNENKLVAYSTVESDKLWSLSLKKGDHHLGYPSIRGQHIYFIDDVRDYDSDTDTSLSESLTIYELAK